MVEIVRFSGYRLYKENLPPEQLAYRWHSLRNEVQQYAPLLAGLDTGFYLDDGDRSINPVDLMMGKLQTGEVYFVFTKDHKDFVGICSINQIAWGRHGFIEAIATPKYHGSFSVGQAMGEIITYAFHDFHEIKGLGLKKLKATISTSNISVAQTLANAGFKPLTVLHAEGLMGGTPTDMILMEMLNPKYFHVEKQVIQNERSTESPQLSSDRIQRPSAAVPSGQHDERTGNDDATTINVGSSTDLSGGTIMAQPEQLQQHAESLSSRRTGRTLESTSDEPNGQLVHAKSSSSASTVSREPDATRRPKLRKLRGSNGGADASTGIAECLPSSSGS